MRDMAVIQKISSQPLAQAGATFGFKVQRFRWPNEFHIHPIGFGSDDGIFHGTILARIPDRHLGGPWAPLPANRSAMRMVGMEDFRSAVDDPPLGWIA